MLLCVFAPEVANMLLFNEMIVSMLLFNKMCAFVMFQ